MSNFKENVEPKQNFEQIGINENGELIVNDPELEAALQELTPEEIAEIAGGATSKNPGCTNIRC